MTKCMFSKDGECKSDYSNLKCDGINIPKECPYSQTVQITNGEEKESMSA